MISFLVVRPNINIHVEFMTTKSLFRPAELVGPSCVLRNAGKSLFTSHFYDNFPYRSVRL